MKKRPQKKAKEAAARKREIEFQTFSSLRRSLRHELESR
jgi:hypothetical protein